MGKETPQEMNGLLDELKSLGAQGGESIEITKEMQVNLEAVVGDWIRSRSSRKN